MFQLKWVFETCYWFFSFFPAASETKKLRCWLTGQSVGWKPDISTVIGRIVMKFGLNITNPQRMIAN